MNSEKSIKWKSEKVKKVWLAVLAVIAAMGLTCSSSTEPYYVLGEGLEQYSSLSRFIIRLGRCMEQERIIPAAVALLLLVLFYIAGRYSFSFRDKAAAFVFSMGFAGMQILGQAFDVSGSWNILFSSGFLIFRTLLRFCGIFALSYVCTLLLFKKIDLSVKDDVKNGVITKKMFFIAVGFVLICWLPYFICFFPGTSNADTATQVAQFFGENSWTRSMTTVRGKDIIFSNHFPFFSTLVYGFFIRIGLWMGNASYGLALHSVIQMVLMSVALTGACFSLYRAGIPYKYVKWGIIFVAVLPFYPLYAICMLKDTAFSIFTLLVSILICEAVRTHGEIWKNHKFCFGFVLASLMMMFFRSQGVYIMVIVTAACIVYFRKYWKQVVCFMVLPILFYQWIWIGILLPSWNVAPVGKQEVLGTLFQQTARYVLNHPDEVTEEEREAIDKVIPYDKLAEKYNGELSDPVKFMYRQDCTQEELKDYLKVWWQMLWKHPGSYVQAVLNNCYGFFYLPREGNLFYSRYYIKERWKGTELDIEPSFLSSEDQQFIYNLQSVLRRIPIVGLLFSPAIYSWLVIFVYLNMIRCKNYGHLLSGAILLVSTGILLICPANANIRYMLPMIIAAPFLAGLSIINYQPPLAESKKNRKSKNFETV